MARIGRRFPSAGTGLVPYRQRSKVLALATYEGASQTRRARGWNAPTIGPNSGVVYSLRTLRDRSRAAVRNDGFADSGIDSLVSNLVGTGILPQSKAPDPAFRERLHQLWLDWTDLADADGLCDFYGLQALAVRGWLEGGEVFIRLRPRLPQDGLPVPLQVQLLEPELVPHEYNGALGGNWIRAGIEFDPIGRRAAYWAYQQRPDQLDPFAGGGTMVRLPAEGVVHLYEPLRAGQIRGLPQLTRALVKLHDLDVYDDATLLRQQLSNLFVGFLTRNGLEGEAQVDPITGQAIEREGDDALIGLEPGLFQELAAGENVTWSDPPEATGYADFMRAQLMGAAVATGVPYEILTGDLREINDRTVRVILQEFRRRVERRQHHTIAFVLNRPVWLAFIQQAVLSGALAVPSAYWDDPTPWHRAEWIPPAWPYLHPVQDVEHEKMMVRAGFKSRAQVVKERGWDIEAVDAEIAADNARADRLGVQFDSDGRRPASGPSPAAALAGERSNDGQQGN
jgi:lambda family phage portal protein